MFQSQNHQYPRGGGERERSRRDFEQIVAENFPNLAKETSIHVQETERTPPKVNENRPTPRHVIVQFANIRSKNTVLNVARAKKFLTYQGKGIRITSDLSIQTWNERKGWGGIFKAFQTKTCSQNPLPSKAVIQNWWRNKNLPESPVINQFRNHETSPTGDIKGGSIKVKRPQE